MKINTLTPGTDVNHGNFITSLLHNLNMQKDFSEGAFITFT